MSDVGLTHIALPVTNMEASLTFYATYAHMRVASTVGLTRMGHRSCG